jgi:hypothetical protein
MAASIVRIKLDGLAPVKARLRAGMALAREVDRSLCIMDENASREVLADALRDFRAVVGEWRPDDEA